MTPVVFALPGNELLAEKIIVGIDGDKGELIVRHFPDGETYVRIMSAVEKKKVIVVCTLHHPDEKLLPLLFLCRSMKELKAKSICLVAPYMAYMRQDKEFNPGEAVTSKYFAEILSSLADRLITVDPHLHRRKSMYEIYSMTCDVLHATLIISDWITNNIENPVLVGPDRESKQWVSAIAHHANTPFIILEKKRNGDKDVEVSTLHAEKYKEHTPVLVDDIISTASTMIATVKLLKAAGMKPPVCIGVHAVFAHDAYEDLLSVGVKEVVTCNTIQHVSNKIDVSEMIINIIKKKIK
jgi:ribose-phosphate pyrophosphokinase